jgi:HK97 gp10 family phage protein
MTKVTVKIEDRQFKAFMQRLPGQFQKATKKSLKQASLLVQGAAKKLAPFKTGNLRRSIAHKLDVTSAKVGSDLDYARMQEFGSGGYAGANLGEGYLRPALDQNEGKISDIFTENINKILA